MANFLLAFAEFFFILLIIFSERSLAIFESAYIYETRHPEKALLIYNEYGVNNSNYLCQSIDGQTSRINGYGVCKKILEKLHPTKYIMDRVICQYQLLKISEYKHVKDKENNNGYGSHLMATCPYGDGQLKSKLYALKADNENFYYVFENDSNSSKLKIKACLKLEKSMDKTIVDIVQTEDDPRVADDIFGVFGIGTIENTKGLVPLCKKISKFFRRESVNDKGICEKLFQTEFMKKKKFNHIQLSRPICEERKLKRNIELNVFGRNEFSGKVDMVKCWYYWSETEVPEYLMILNAPKINFYYIAEKEAGTDPEFIITSCVEI